MNRDEKIEQLKDIILAYSNVQGLAIIHNKKKLVDINLLLEGEITFREFQGLSDAVLELGKLYDEKANS